MNHFQILLFYTYAYIEDPQSLRSELVQLCTSLALTGRLIVAHEGLNATLEGTVANTEAFIETLIRDKRFSGIHFKRSPGTGSAFSKLSIKVRDEIVSGNLTKGAGANSCDVDPTVATGKRLSPETLHEWFETSKEFYIVDMRNTYEHASGRFEGSILPKLENFRDLPKIIDSIKHLRHKTVLTVCTGGVRCEKASGYLLTQGFTDVWQLDGGIVTYMEKYPNEHFLGKLYVFDNRVLMGFYTDDPKHTVIGKCLSCAISTERYVNCSRDWCGKHFLLCEACEEAMVQKKKSGFVTCPDGCRVRKPDKIHSSVRRMQAILLDMKNKMFSRGFTLIELLVVIAVIGILAAIVLAALGSARDKGKAAKIQQEMASARSQAELYRSNSGNTFNPNKSGNKNVCDAGSPGSINAMVTDALHVYKPTNNLITTGTQSTGAASTNLGMCHVSSDGSAWVASVPVDYLSTGSVKSFWCVDSSGASKLEPAANKLLSSSTSCL